MSSVYPVAAAACVPSLTPVGVHTTHLSGFTPRTQHCPEVTALHCYTIN